MEFTKHLTTQNPREELITLNLWAVALIRDRELIYFSIVLIFNISEKNNCCLLYLFFSVKVLVIFSVKILCMTTTSNTKWLSKQTKRCIGVTNSKRLRNTVNIKMNKAKCNYYISAKLSMIKILRKYDK